MAPTCAQKTLQDPYGEPRQPRQRRVLCCALKRTTLSWKLFYSEKVSHSWRLPIANAFLQPLSGLPWELTAEILLPSAATTRGCRERWPLRRRAHAAWTVGCVWEQEVFFLKRNSGLAVVAVCNGMVPSKSMYHNAWMIYSQMCEAGKKILYQVIKEKCLQDTLYEYLFVFWNVFALAVFMPLFICFRAFAKNKSTGKNFYRSNKGQATIARLESGSFIYDGWKLMLKRAQAHSFRYVTHTVPCDLLFQWKKVTFQIANILRSKIKIILKTIFKYEY